VSAFLVSAEHIGAIVRWYFVDAPAYHRSGEPIDPAAVLAELARENCRSVHYRYPDDAPGEDLPGPIGNDGRPVVCDPDLRTYPALSPIAVVKLCQSLEYQSCEHPQWEKSQAKRYLDAIVSVAITQIPGYEAAEWAL
jgi:hypothetical protein